MTANRPGAAWRAFARTIRPDSGDDAIPPAHCPHCAHRVDRATSDDGVRPAAPTTGELCYAVCMYCAGVSVYGVDPELRAIGEAEIAAFPAADRAELEDARALIRAAHLRRLARSRQAKS